MSGQKFQYDESGGTFFYFLLSFLALILIPSTFYLWPRTEKPDPSKFERECYCDGCKKKKVLLQKRDPWKKTKAWIKKFIIIFGWIIFMLLAYKVSQFDYEMANFDPFEILGVAPGSSANTIRKAYRQLSLILHPDKETGNEKAFMRLTKAYQALTDKEAMKNWEKYGNPDGPGAMGFGIALPSWIVEKENSVWVLGLYALVFMVALPTAVGIWWYRSIKYTGDQVLFATTKIYFYFIDKDPNITMKRLIMILGASFEFNKRFNNEINERITDADEVPALMKQLATKVQEKNQELPLCHLYAKKARTLIHAHLDRLPLNPETLDKDRQYIVKKCPYLIQEMVSCMNQLTYFAYAQQANHVPKIQTIENAMKLCPMIVQALDGKNPFLQLPHITEDMLKHFKSKKCWTLQQFAELKRADRRAVLRSLSDSQFEDVMRVLGHMPCVEFKVKSEVIDDDVSTYYTAGALITVTVTLIRKDMKHFFGDETVKENAITDGDKVDGDKENEEENQTQTNHSAKRPAWLKQKKVPKKSHSKKGTNKKPVVSKSNAQNVASKNKADANGTATTQEDELTKENAKEEEKKSNKETKKASEKSSDVSDSGTKTDESDDEESSHEKDDKGRNVDDDETEWNKFQSRLTKRDKILEGRSNKSHEVHCPYFPDVKQEYWWVYICNRKGSTLMTAPTHVTSLVDKEEFQLRLSAPPWPGLITLTVCLRSDSYFGFDQCIDIKLDVKEAPEVPVEHPQWDMSDEETAEDAYAVDEHSEYATDEDISDNE